jgi:hypothetical protein
MQHMLTMQKTMGWCNAKSQFINPAPAILVSTPAPIRPNNPDIAIDENFFIKNSLVIHGSGIR